MKQSLHSLHKEWEERYGDDIPFIKRMLTEIQRPYVKDSYNDIYVKWLEAKLLTKN